MAAGCGTSRATRTTSSPAPASIVMRLTAALANRPISCPWSVTTSWSAAASKRTSMRSRPGVPTMLRKAPDRAAVALGRWRDSSDSTRRRMASPFRAGLTDIPSDRQSRRRFSGKLAGE